MKPDLRAAPSPDQLLSSWKDIANYLRRDVRTVQRWETTHGLPVHRLPGGGRNAIYALRSEIDAWWSSSPARSEPAAVVALTAKPRSRAALLMACILLPVLVGYLTWLSVRRNRPPGPSPATPLTSLPGAEIHPVLSPDGSQLAFSWKREADDNYDVYMMDLPSGQPERLTTSPALDWFPEWSPDGTRVAYVRIAVGADHFELRILDLRDRKDRLIYTSPLPAVEAPAWVFTWGPDGNSIVLPALVDRGPRYGLSRLDIATGTLTPLTKPDAPALGDRLPAFSPDGRSLIFLRKPLSGDGNIFRLNLNNAGAPAGNPLQVTGEPCCVESPSWSKDGKEIAFLSSAGGARQIMRVPAQGGKPEADPSIAAPGFAPRIASNGWLIYSTAETAGAILSVELSGGRAVSKPRRFIASSRRDRSPAYSPDGKLIVFSSDRGGTRQLWLCSRDGSSPRQLTNLEGPVPGVSSWSPSGRWIAFEAQSGAASGIYLAEASSGKVRSLKLNGDQNRRPQWSRNGRDIYYASNRTGRYEICRAEIGPEGELVRTSQLTRNGGFGAVESADGRFLYYSKDFTFKTLGRVPAGGGKEEDVLSGFPFNRYPAILAAGARGVYFRGQGEAHGAPLWFLPYSGRKPRQVLIETALPFPAGIAVSPGDRQLLLSVFTHTAGDILAVKSFN